MRETTYQVRRAGFVLKPETHGLRAKPDNYERVRLERLYGTLLWASAPEGTSPQHGAVTILPGPDASVRLAAFVLDLPTGWPEVDVDAIAQRGGQWHVPDLSHAESDL